MSRVQDKLVELIAPVVEPMGLELVGIEYLAQGRHSLLRIYLDKPEGITLEDCQRASHQISGVMDVEDPIHGHYTLEVSSPGLDRPLFTAQQFARFTGREVKLRLHRPVDGRRKLRGIIERVEEENIYISDMDQEDLEFCLQMENIEKANLVPDFQDG